MLVFYGVFINNINEIRLLTIGLKNCTKSYFISNSSLQLFKLRIYWSLRGKKTTEAKCFIFLKSILQREKLIYEEFIKIVFVSS